MMLRSSVIALLLAGVAGAQRPSGGGTPNPMDSIRRLPNYRPAHDTVTLLSLQRLEKLPPAQQRDWFAYIGRSTAEYAHDTAVMHRELRQAHMREMVRAPYTHDFSVKPYMTPAWFATDTARRIADAIASYQAPNGGWSKHVDFTLHPRQPGESYYGESNEWQWISTFDNDQTTEEIHFLNLASRAHADSRYERAIARGIDYVLDTQYPNGCFPQVYPLEGSYHDAVTFNDNVAVNVLTLLDSVAAGSYPAVTNHARQRAAAASARGLACILDAQVRVNGELTAWGQQHDPLTLAPTSARSYELTSLAGLESSEILDYLMSLPTPSPRVVAAVYAGANWFKRVPVNGYTYEHYVLTPKAGAGPLWGRLYEIGTNRVIMANRDGKTLYDWNQLTDRRSGYGWYSAAPAAMLARFDAWSQTHPQAP